MPTIFDEIANAVKLELDLSSRLVEEVWKRFRFFGAWIDGIEATQTIQYYRSDEHLTDPATHRPVQIEIQGERRSVDAFQVEHGIIWGMTERILGNLLPLLV